MFNEFNELADHCYDLASQHIRAPIGPSFVLALLAAWMLALPSGNLWWLLAAIPLFLLFWFLGSVTWYWVWSRWRFRRACRAVQRFEQRYRCTPERMRSLWTLAATARVQSGRILMFDESSERAIAARIPHLRHDADRRTAGRDTIRPA